MNFNGFKEKNCSRKLRFHLCDEEIIKQIEYVKAYSGFCSLKAVKSVYVSLCCVLTCCDCEKMG